MPMDLTGATSSGALEQIHLLNPVHYQLEALIEQGQARAGA